jgi:hypothetical protein
LIRINKAEVLEIITPPAGCTSKNPRFYGIIYHKNEGFKYVAALSWFADYIGQGGYGG